MSEKDEQCKDHKIYKETVERLQRWLNHSQENVPSMKERSLGDKLAIENMLTPLEAILNTKAQGEELLENVKNRSQVILPSLSETGQQNVKSEVADLNNKFQSFFNGMLLLNDFVISFKT